MTTSATPSTVLVVVHDEVCPPDFFQQFVKGKLPNAIVEVVDLPSAWEKLKTSTPSFSPSHVSVPSLLSHPLSSYTAIVTLGGRQDAFDLVSSPYIQWERSLVSESITHGVPLLGICLGAQIMADAIGGKTFRMPHMEVGTPSITVSSEGKYDVLISELIHLCRSATECDILPFVEHHQDSFALPKDFQSHRVDLLASSVSPTDHRQIPQMFRCRSAYGVQFHPEATRADYEKWLRRHPETYPKDEGIKKTVEELMADYDAQGKALAASTKKFFDCWWTVVEDINAERRGDGKK